METTSQNSGYTREKWGSLPIQERIKAMNGTLELGDPQSLLDSNGEMLPTQEPTPETSRRISVVDMWRQRDRNKQTMSASEGPDHDEEEKKDEEPCSNDGGGSVDGGGCAAVSTIVVTKPSQARSMWSERNKTAPQNPSVARPTSVMKTIQSVGGPVITEEQVEIDMTIVPSPAKQGSESCETEEAANCPSQKTRPRNVVDFWARQGLKPMSKASSVDHSIKSPTPEKFSSPWNNRAPTALSSSTEGSLTSFNLDSAALPATQSKLSVVDRWKQRVDGKNESETPEPPAPKKPISERWTAAVKKPEPANKKSRPNIADRWLNRQETQDQKSPVRTIKASTPKRQPYQPAAIVPPGVVSPASRSRTTASTTASWPSETTTENNDDVPTTVEGVTSDKQPSMQNHYVEGAPTETPGNSPHITRRWSNRLDIEAVQSDTNYPAKELSDSNSCSSPSLPEPRLKKTECSSITEASSQSLVDKEASSNDKTVFEKLEVPKPVPNGEHHSLATPCFQQTGLSWKVMKPTRKSPGSVAKLRYETALKSKGEHLGATSRNDTEGLSTSMLLVLISGQSFNRGQGAINQQISTILNSHNIPYEKIDGSLLSMRERRNELFKVSGLWAQYPQFFVRRGDETIFWGTWNEFECCNDSGRIVDEFTPGPDLEPPLIERKVSHMEDHEHFSLPSPERLPESNQSAKADVTLPSVSPDVDRHSSRRQVDHAKSSTTNNVKERKTSSKGRMCLPLVNNSKVVQNIQNDHASLAKNVPKDEFRDISVEEINNKDGIQDIVERGSRDTPLSDCDIILQPSQSTDSPSTEERILTKTEAQIAPSSLDRNLQNPSPATTCSGASLSQSSQTSPAPRRDFQSLKARRIGQRLIEKKRELQAHRLRLKNNRSMDSNDLSLSGTKDNAGKESSVTTSMEIQGVQAGKRSVTNIPNPPPPPPQQRNNPTINEGNFSLPSQDIPSPKKQTLRVSTDPPAKSPTAESAKSPTPEGAFAFLSSPTKSDGGDSVSSRGSSTLSIRAEKVLKQRRQRGNLEHVDEALEWSEEHMHAQELTRHVLYGRPVSGKHHSPSNQLRVETEQSSVSSPRNDANVASRRSPPPAQRHAEYDPHIPSQHDTHPTERLDQQHSPFSGLDDLSSQRGAYNLSRPHSSSGTIGNSPSMTRQRASLSSRYRTSDRFMDESDLEPFASPKSTKSLPNTRKHAERKKSARLDSTRSAPSRRYYNDAYSSSDTPDQTPTSSTDLQSTSSQASRDMRRRLHESHSEMDSTFDGRSFRSSNYGINEEFTTKSANDYSAFQNAYSRMTFGQLAADFAGEVSNALNLERLQEDVKVVLQGVGRINSEPISEKTRQRAMVPASDMVPFDEEDVAIEVEYMETPPENTVTTPPSADLSSEGQTHRRRRRAADV
jgi:hypothetical protein